MMRDSSKAADDDDLIADLDEGGKDWLKIIKEAYGGSTTFFDAALRPQLARNYSNFRSKHPDGSKYHTDAYKYRSKIFRPKTRAALTRKEAAAAVAYFSNQDALDVRPENENDKEAFVAARYKREVLNYRLENDIPWFITAIGAFQESMVAGCVISYQYWEYAEQEIETHSEFLDEETDEPVMGEDGNPLIEVTKSRKVVVDRPVIELVPIENVRFDPQAKWTDPINTSPYVIRMIPMYIQDVVERMESVDSKTGQPKWKPLDEQQLKRFIRNDYDDTRRAREAGRVDPQTSTRDTPRFGTIWVHENFIRRDGVDYVVYTIEDRFLLTDPVPIEQVYWHGERPLVRGISNLEAHRPYPAGDVEIAEGLQQEANDTANQRLDNVKLALNKSYWVRRGATVDYSALMKNVPGGITHMDDIQQDVKVIETNDVTQSSYKEQELINLDFDEVLGNFSAASVQSNRRMNETVGGMEMLSNDSNQVIEYRLRIFAETWMKPALRQLMKLEEAYETDEVVMAICGERIGVGDQMAEQGPETMGANLMAQPVKVKLNVGFGATSPDKRVEKLTRGLGAIGQLVPGAIMQLDGSEVIKEVMGALGYDDGLRFFPSLRQGAQEDPRIQQLMQQVQQLQQVIDQKQVEAQTKLQVEKMRVDGNVQVTKVRGEIQMQIQQLKNQIDQLDVQVAVEENQIKREEITLQRQALTHQMLAKESELRLADVQNKNNMSQVLMRDRYGSIPDKQD